VDNLRFIFKRKAASSTAIVFHRGSIPNTTARTMRTSIAVGLLAVGNAYGFSDSSPFLLFSTAKYAS